jgi:HAD superfamily hydrolase (TIGR01484 family)
MTDGLNNLLLLPTSGTKLFVWRGTWQQQYAEDLTRQEKDKVVNALDIALKTCNYAKPERTYGAIIEDRGSQITFSAFGQEAPLIQKQKWDPDWSKRKAIIEIMKDKIPEFDVRMGGMTSIDITRRGVNKGYGIQKLKDFLKIPTESIVFIGDALFHGGNDYPARASGVDCIEVKDPNETKKIIGDWLA